MAGEDKAPFELDLSLPEGSLDDAVWNRIVADALAMPASAIDASIVPEFDEADEVVLSDEDLNHTALGADSDAQEDTAESEIVSGPEFVDPDFNDPTSEAELGIDPGLDAGEFSPELDAETDLDFE